MLKPIDIQNKDFEQKLRGYDRDEVDDFLDQIITDMTTLYRDNTELTEKVEKLTNEVNVFRARELEIDKSLELARYQCVELKKNAQFEAKEIISAAKVQSETMLHGLENNRIRLKAAVSEILDKINSL